MRGKTTPSQSKMPLLHALHPPTVFCLLTIWCPNDASYVHFSAYCTKAAPTSCWTQRDCIYAWCRVGLYQQSVSCDDAWIKHWRLRAAYMHHGNKRHLRVYHQLIHPPVIITMMDTTPLKPHTSKHPIIIFLIENYLDPFPEIFRYRIKNKMFSP